MNNDNDAKNQHDCNQINQTCDHEQINFQLQIKKKLEDYQFQSQVKNTSSYQSIIKQQNLSQFEKQVQNTGPSINSLSYKFNIKQNKLQENTRLNSIQIGFKALQTFFANLKSEYFQQFCNDITSWYIQTLKDQNRRIRDTKFIEEQIIQNQNWPFKELYYKINKSQNQKMMMQFVNMCASKIQAAFKGHITRKRHLNAIKNVKLFKQKFTAVLKGWKTWNVFNCKKIKQIRLTIKNLQKQEDELIMHSNLQKHLKVKKMAYLKSNQELNKKIFKDMLEELYIKGTWIFQIQKCFKILKPKGPHHLEHSYYPNQIKHQEGIQKNTTTQKKRGRQFFKNRNKNMNQNIEQTKIQKNVKNVYQQKQFHNRNQIPLDQRPICTKGQYKFDQQNLSVGENQFLKIKQKVQQNRQHQKQTDFSQIKQAQGKRKIQQKKKLQKRHKYDPRKAIQQAKKKKDEEKKLQKNQQSKQVQTEQQKKDRKDNSMSKSRQKTVQKVPKKQKNLNKKDDNSKSVKSITLKGNTKVDLKTGPKIDCWGGQTSSGLGKKQQKLKIKAIVQQKQQNSYKSKYINQILKKRNDFVKTEQNQQPQQKQVNKYKLNYQLMKQKQTNLHQKNEVEHQKNIQNQRALKFAKLIKQKNLIEKQEYEKQISHNEQLKGRFSNIAHTNSIVNKAKNTRQEQIQKSQISSKKQKKDYLNYNMKQIILKKQNAVHIQSKNERYYQKNQNSQGQKTSQAIIKPIQQLQKVYDTQYYDRFANLKPKLQMLANTRQIQFQQTIPVISQEGKFIKRIMKQHSNMFWQQAKKLDSNFIQYIGRV